MVTERLLPGGGTTTLGGGTPFRPVPAVFNHWLWVCDTVLVLADNTE